MKSWVLALGVLVLAATPGSAQDLTLRVRAVQYPGEQALGGNATMALARQGHGYLWLGTQRVLGRYDGIRVTPLHPEMYVTALVEGAGGDVWVGSHEGRVHRYTARTDTLARVPLRGLARGAITALYAAAPGPLWVAVQDSGLFRADPPYLHATRVPFARDAVQVLLPSHSQPGVLWAGTSSGVVALGEAGEETEYRLQGVSVTALAEANGELWCGSGTGALYRLSAGAATAHVTGLPSDVSISDLVASRARPGLLWIGTRGAGVLAFDMQRGQAVRVRTDALPLSRLDVLDVHEDAQGTLWIATMSGLYRAALEAPRFEPHRIGMPARTDLSKSVVSLHASAAEPGVVWAGTIRGGVTRYDMARRKVERFFTDPGHPLNLSFAIHEDAAQRLWMAAGEHATLYLFNRARGTATGFPLTADPQASGILKSLYAPPSRPGTLYVSTRERGIVEFDVNRKVVTRHFADTTLAGAKHVWSVLEAPDEPGILYAATDDQGVVRLDLGTGAAAPVRGKGTPQCPIEVAAVALAADGEGALWVGTYGQGLVRFDRRTGICRTYDAVASVAPDPGALALDARGRVWMSGNTTGLAVFDPVSEVLTRFGPDDGLQGSLFYFNALHQQPGWLLVGGQEGFNAFNPDRFFPDTTAYPTVLTRLLIDGRPRPLPRQEGAYEGLGLAYDERDIEVAFAGLDLRRPHLNRYRVRLDEGDAAGAWRYVSAEQASERYPRLAPGRYTLRVESTNRDGVWSRQAAVLPFRILPPFYATWWFRSLLLALAGAVALTLHQLRVQQLLRLARLRSRIAGDLHDEIGADVSALALRAEAASVRATLDGDTRQTFEAISGSARETAQRVREVVWVLNARYDTLGKLVSKLEDTAAALLAGCLPYSFHRPADLPDLPIGMEARQHVYFLFKEALRNAAEHAHATRLDIAIGFERGLFTFTVADDGTGFDVENGRQGNGLGLMRERAEKSGGTLHIDSAPGEGTTVQFALRLKG